jgi:hypothetical protein
MLILLSASKNRIGSFVTPTILAYSANITSNASNAFKYGNFLNSTLASFQKGGSYFTYSDLVSSIQVSAIESYSFKFGQVLQSSSKISSVPAWYLFYPKTPTKAFMTSNGILGLFISPKTAEPGFVLGIDSTITIISGNPEVSGFALYLDRFTNTLSAPSGSGISQTLMFQPE